MPRVRDLGIYQSQLSPGPNNAITDVAGVTVGHYTLIAGKVPGQETGLSDMQARPIGLDEVKKALESLPGEKAYL